MPKPLYDSIVRQLQARGNLPPLAPESVWHPGLDVLIAELPERELAAELPEGPASAKCWKAALHLWNDSLDAAHALVQDLPTQTASVLHGIVHRREGDFGNAKYWFRRAGDHPAYHGLQARAAEWIGEWSRVRGLPPGPVGEAARQMSGQGLWNPFLFADMAEISCGRAADEAARTVLENVQYLELAAILRFLEPRISSFS